MKLPRNSLETPLPFPCPWQQEHSLTRRCVTLRAKSNRIFLPPFSPVSLSPSLPLSLSPRKMAPHPIFRLDYCGITLLSTGSFIPWIHYAFNCRPEHRFFYLSFVTVLGMFVAWFSLRDKFGTAQFRVIRACVFVAFGLSIALPFSHWMISVTHVRISLINVALVALFYIGGAFLYAMRIPERFFPGKCDYWFQSHQIFHIFVIIAAIIHYVVIHDIASLKFIPKDASPIPGPILSSSHAWHDDHCDL